ncbi:2OG-Fe(II) oxygenase [Marinicella sediminis]|uniref:2OG-Fe(II) oxygenase n=1 Tax=Marinicella sediminis TaxID=1792834 RepID=A0ABV7J9U5_9GAMM|nr:2OG-Fe(II) oxygenase [Marinicella sediminis]
MLLSFLKYRKALRYLSENQSYLPLKFMADHVQDWHSEYINGSPFPHIAIDDFFAPEVLDVVEREFAEPEQQEDWTQFRNVVEWHKNGTSHDSMIPMFTRHLIYELNARPFLSFLEKLTGIPDLLPDPDLVGGGLHSVLPRGRLEVHADFNAHPRTQFTRRINVLIYLNKKWLPEYGGNLELWNHDISRMEVEIEPIFNRISVFNTDENSFHGHPKPLNCPEDRQRKSIAMYYYTRNIPEKIHSTVYKISPAKSRP